MNEYTVCSFLLSSVLTLSLQAAELSPLETDWMRQLDLRLAPSKNKKPPQQKKNITTQDDAGGAVDGIRNGQWGFHTANENTPWWQIDLGEETAVDRLEIYNRCDSDTMASRNARLSVLFSPDGKTWTSVYKHNGTTFFGHSDKKPLEVKADNAKTRFIRLQIPGKDYFHLDEVEVYGTGDPKKNIAISKPANQSSVSQWSTGPKKAITPSAPVVVPDSSFVVGTRETLRRGRLLLEDLKAKKVNCSDFDKAAASIEEELNKLTEDSSPDVRRDIYFSACRAVRTLAFKNPLLDFDSILLTKRVHGSFSHMSDQYFGWWSRPGGGIFALTNWKSDDPKLTCLTEEFEEGSFLRPMISYNGKKFLFAYCKYYEHVSKIGNKTNKNDLPEDSFYQTFEMNIDGSGLRRLTQGKYNSFDARYLPDGRIVFLSTRRAQFLQCGKLSAMKTYEETCLPESYVRCGGGPSRPCAVYTLHTMDADGKDMINISGFEMFEWTPSVSHDGTVMFARWDYVDRHNNAFMSLWESNPDGTDPRHVYGNYTTTPHCIFEARAIPGSRKLIATASAHHSVTAGSLILIDTARGLDGMEPLTRLTPETCFPEMEGWPKSWYVNPWAFSEEHFLTGWSHMPLKSQGGRIPHNCVGTYLYDAFGNLTLLSRDESISTMYPIPIKERKTPIRIASSVKWDGPQQGKFMLTDVYQGVLKDMPRGSIKKLRLIAVPPKTQPTMNRPNIGMKGDDPGKCVLGTVPVEEDGSAYFFAPSGITIFFQALDEEGVTVQTMRTGTYLMPGQTLSCVGCHEPKYQTPSMAKPTIASKKAPAKMTLGPSGSWPLRYDQLVQPVLDRHCVKCHDGKPGEDKSKLNLANAAASYKALTRYGKVSLHNMNREQLRIHIPETRPYEYMAKRSSLLEFLKKGHPSSSEDYDATGKEVKLTDEDMERLLTWMDTYAQLLGHFSDEQEQRLTAMRKRHANIIIER
ncbi:MAG: discoidin domain-containing protein [Kiritimatiellia bacterium]|nr:discoidin domain-containing protein [Kiritimatiellia bacterium]